MKILLAVLALAAPTWAFTPSPVTDAVAKVGPNQTPRDGAALEIEAILSHLQAPETRAKLSAVFQELKKKVAGSQTVTGRLRAAYARAFHGRKLQSSAAEAAITDLTNVLSNINSYSSVNEVYLAAKPALCDGNSAKARLVEALDPLIASALGGADLPFTIPSVQILA